MGPALAQPQRRTGVDGLVKEVDYHEDAEEVSSFGSLPILELRLQLLALYLSFFLFLVLNSLLA